jgi:hypothetical protein
MASIKLPASVTHQSFIEAVAAGDVMGLTGETYRIHVPRKCFISCSAIAAAGAWGQEMRRRGHGVEFYGDDDTLRYMARMDLFKLLEFPYRENFERHTEGGRFIPLHKVENTKECVKVINRIGDVVLHHFDNAREFFPAMEWAVNEVMDNIAIHSETPVPGVACAQFFPEKGRVEFGICDMGRGIKASLSERYELLSHGDAITKALERGVTRNPEVGQGNGLAGTLQIARANEGTFHLWSGDACFKMSQGKEPSFTIIPETRGTGIWLSLDTTKPVNLRTDTFIGDSQFGDNESTYIYSESERVTTGDGLVVADECFHTGSRPPAKDLRRKILTLLPDVDKQPLLLNFAGVKSASSSFLDELLGRLVLELGAPVFKSKVTVVNMSEHIKQMANVVIKQRLELGNKPPEPSDP